MTNAIGFAFPVLPGREPAIQQLVASFKDPQVLPAYTASRTHGGVALERLYLQNNPVSWQRPLGAASLLNTYLETGPGGLGQFLASLGDGSPFNNNLLSCVRANTGVDLLAWGQSNPLTHGADWSLPGANRLGGVSLTAPLGAGGNGAFLQQFEDDIYELRAADLAASRQAFGITREQVLVQTTPSWPGGNLINLYIEGPQVGGNLLAASAQNLMDSGQGIDQSFLKGLQEMLPAFVAVNEPPAISQLWDWQLGQPCGGVQPIGDAKPM